MKLFDWFKPLDKAIGVVDKYVLDKDAANALRAELSMAQLQLRGMVEDSYRQELSVKTIPWVDALHKMSRPILSLLNLLVPTFTVIILAYMEVPLTEKHMIVLGLGNGASMVYTAVKGKGNPTT